MPRQEMMKSPEELHSLAFQSHLQRTRDRITVFSKRLAELDAPGVAQEARLLVGANKVVPYAQERADIASELQLLERQLTEPLSEMTLKSLPVKGQEPMNPVMALVQTLQRELSALKAKLGEPADAEVVQPAAAAS